MLTPDQKARAKKLWDEDELSAAQIGLRFLVSKNVIIGIANRQGWRSKSAHAVKAGMRRRRSGR